MENDQLFRPVNHARQQQERIKSQADLEDWLRGQCLLDGVDPMRVRLAADVKPLFDREPQKQDFPDDDELYQEAVSWFGEHQWSYEQITVTVIIHGVALAAHSGIIIGGSYPVRPAGVAGEICGLSTRTVLSYEDPLAEWLTLAAVAVTRAEEMLTMLRGVEIAWPTTVDVSQSSPAQKNSDDSPLPN